MAERVMDGLKGAGSRIAGDLKTLIAEDVSRPIVEATSDAVESAHEYVRGNPWTAIGIAAAAGALIGFIAARR
jgi:ElaB/YqjD/DUF883 family membrane-anchored ribosome-binding protein